MMDHHDCATFSLFVIPAKAGIHLDFSTTKMDSGLRRNDGFVCCGSNPWR
jgi:hypothetical protein